ncbi:MAG: tail fiber domain-containing protein, partial [Bdellovibrionales bacterium]|nr:tail fiber domain-containing protein [Bdellovibrionales bacterium]
TSALIAADTIVAGDIATNGVGAAEIAAGAVGTSEIANGTVASADLAQQSTISFSATAGNGIRFWNADTYKIYMSIQSDATWGGRLDATSDYNMYFRMSGGTNRGFVFKNNTTAVAQIDGAGNVIATSFTGNGSGLTNIGAAALAAGSVGSSEVIDNSLTASDLAANSVGTSEIVNGSVTSTDIANGTIATADIAANAITSALIAADTIVAADIATNGVGAAEIAADAVGSSEIATDAVGAAEIAAGAVGTSEIANGSVTSTDIANGTIATADIAANAITTALIAADTIVAADIATNGVGAAEIAAGAVGTSEIANGTVAVADLNTASVDTRYLRINANQETTGNHTFRNTAPTLFMRDTDHRSGMIHVNSGHFYVITANGTDSTTMAPNGTYYPIDINMTNDLITLGGSVQILDGGTLNVAGAVTAPSFISTSDARLKMNVETLDGALGAVSKLRGVSFDWIKNGEPEIGFIAQEVEEIFPELVVTDPETGIKAVKYSNIVAPLVEATKELKVKCEATEKDKERIAEIVKKHGRQLASHESRLNKLEKENKELKKELEELKDLIRQKLK